MSLKEKVMYSRGRTSSRDRSWRAPYCRQNPGQLCCLMKSYRSVCHVEVSLLYLSTALLVGILISQDRSHTSRICKSFVSFPLRTIVEGRQRIQGHQILLNSELSDKPLPGLLIFHHENIQQRLPPASRRLLFRRSSESAARI